MIKQLADAPWPATLEELIDYANRNGLPVEIIENLQQMEDEGEYYYSIDDLWPDRPNEDEYDFNPDEY